MYLRQPSFKRVSSGLNSLNSNHSVLYSGNRRLLIFNKKYKRLEKIRKASKLKRLSKIITTNINLIPSNRNLLLFNIIGKLNNSMTTFYGRSITRQQNSYWNSLNLISKPKRYKRLQNRFTKKKNFTNTILPKKSLINGSLVKLYRLNLLRKFGNHPSYFFHKLNLNILNTIKLRPIYNSFNLIKLHNKARNALALKLKNLYNFKFKKFRRFYRFKSIKILKKSMYKNLTNTSKHTYAGLLEQHYFDKQHPLLIKTCKSINPSFIMPKSFLKSDNYLKSFRLDYLSLFLKFRLLSTNLSFNSEKFLIRKTLFSFLKSNEVKKSIMRRRRKIKTFRLYKRLSTSDSYNYKHSLTHTTRLGVLRKYSNKYNPSLPISSKINNKDSFELFLPRVKFKPGYQRLWRQSRSAMAENIGLKYLYQQQMTKHVANLSRKVNFYSFSMNENSLNKAILYSRLLPDNKAVLEFLNLGLISLNGWKLNNISSFTIPGDFIQITISKWLSIYFKWLVTWSKSNKNKFKNLIFRKGKPSAYKLMKQRKQKSSHVPSWVYNSRFDMSDIKPNYEVDYFTMSSIVLYEPLLLDYYTPDDMPDHRHYIYRLYNWKYIT